MASIGDIFLRMLADDSGFKADLIKKGVAAGDAAGLSMGKRMGASLGKSLNQNLGRGVSNAVNNIGKMAVSAGLLAVGGGAAALKWAGDFEAQLNTINTIARETPEGLAKIGDEIRKIARETGTPLEELTQGYYDLLSAGVAAADAPKVLAEANKLAIGGLASAAEGVDLLTTAINVYGGDASQAGRFTDEFAKAVERGKVTVAELAGSYAQVAPLAKSLNIENKELAAGYATLTAAGTPAAEAATQMASAMTALLKKSAGLEKLEKQTKKNYASIAGEKGLNVALQEMQIDADKAGIELIDLVGRKEALLYILQTTGPNMAKYNADLAAMGDSAGTAAAQMAERQQGLNFQLARAKALFKDAGITIGTALMPKLIPLIEKFNEFISGNQEGIKQFGTELANAFEGIAQWIARLDFNAIANSLKLAGTFAKGLVSAFMSAPQWLQAAVVTGWGLNKLTGGAVGSIFGDLAKTALTGFLQQFVQRGANPGNPLYVADVTGGLGVAGAAGKAGLLGTLLRGIFPVSVVLGIGYAIGSAVVEAMGGQLTPEEQKTGTGRTVANVAGVDVVMGQNYAAQVRAEDERRRKAQNLPGSPDERQARADLHDLAEIAYDEQRRGERDSYRTADQLAGIDSTLTALRHQMHADLQAATNVLRSSNDPAAIAAAVDAAVAAVKGGAGSAGTTTTTVGALKEQLAAAQAAGNTDLAAKIKAAIAQIEPFAKGRQWQAEQIAKAREIVASNKSTADKVAALKGIQQDLLSHNRTMASGIIGKLIDVETAVKNVKINAATGFATTGPYSKPKPGSKPPPKPAPSAPSKWQSPDRHAAGLLGFTKGATDIGVAGEAGTEAVAIIKNPKKLTAGQIVRVFVTNWPGSLESGAGDTAPATVGVVADLRKQLHEDFVQAISALRKVTDPKAILEAAGRVVKAMLGGVGSAGTTKDAIAELREKRDAAKKAGDKATVQALNTEIKKLLPLVKGREWQAKQLAAAAKIAESKDSPKEKLAKLKKIQAELLASHRTSAAEQVATLIRSLPKFAAGGIARAGIPALFGEYGPELAVPRVSARVHTAAQTRDILSDSAGNTTINVPIQGLIPYRDAMTIPNQLRRLGSLGVLTPNRQPSRP